MTSIQMPQLGETIIEGTILKWLKTEGEHIDRDEPLFEISTDKVDTEVPSPVAGTVTKILVPRARPCRSGPSWPRSTRATGGTAAPAGAGGSRRCRRRAGGDQAPPGRSSGGASPRRRRAGARLRRRRLPRRRCRRARLVRLPPPPLRRPRRRGSGSGCHGQPGSRGRRSCRRWCGGWRRSTDRPVAGRRAPGPGGGSRSTTCRRPSTGAGPARPPRGPPAPRRRRPRRRPAPAVAGAGEEVVPMSTVRKAIAEHMVASLQTPRAHGTWSRSTWRTSFASASARRTRSRRARASRSRTCRSWRGRSMRRAARVPRRQRGAAGRGHRAEALREPRDRGELRRGPDRAGDQGRGHDEHGRAWRGRSTTSPRARARTS